MKISMIAFYTFLRNVRDVKSIIAFILMPLTLILILGAVVDSDFAPKTVEPVKVGYLSEDEGMISSTIVQFLKSEEFGSLLQLEEVANVDQGTEWIKSGELNSFIHVPANSSQRLEQGVEARIEFYSKGEASFIQTALENFIQTFNLDDTLLRINGQSLENERISSNILEVKIVTEGIIPRGIDYLTITMLLQCLLYGALFGVLVINKDMGNHTYSRLLAAPVHSSRILLGKLTGSTITLYGIALFIFLLTKYAFGANWNGSLWMILLVLFLFTVISVSLGMLLAYLTKSTMISSLTIFVFATVCTVVSGGYTPVEGEVFDLLSRFAPNSYAQKALFADIYEGTIEHTTILGLVLYTGIILLLTFVSERRKFA
jgi:ABC-2 type transport system permease protein